jgi:6-aminohexanoate-oligomer endohydrolase
MYEKKYFKYKTKYFQYKKNETKESNDENNNTNDNVDISKQIITNDNICLYPSIGKSNRMIKFNFPEISVASVQYNEGPTGCTYVRFNTNNTRYFMDSRGGSVATFATNNTRSNSKIRGICFSGGSTLGLETVSGCVMEEMKKINYSDHGKCHVIGTTLRSANLDYNYIYPDKNLGRFAVNNLIPYPFNDNNKDNKQNISENIVYLGQVGVGCMAGDGFYGQGAYFLKYKEIKIFVFSGVNALGTIYNTKGDILKDRWALSNEKSPYVSLNENTTLTTVVTDLSLSFTELKQLAIQCHTNMAVIIRPFHTIGDGDVLFSVTLNIIDRSNIKDFNILEFYDVCSKCANSAILNCFD